MDTPNAYMNSESGLSTDNGWVSTWGTSNTRLSTKKPSTGALTEPSDAEKVNYLGNRTIRNQVHAAVGGRRLRIWLSNAFGGSMTDNEPPLHIGHATVALAVNPGGDPDKLPEAKPGTMRTLTFNGGSQSCDIPMCGRMISDPVDLQIDAGTDLLISVYTPDMAKNITYHHEALQFTHQAEGDYTTDESGRPFVNNGLPLLQYWYLIEGADAADSDATATVVCFGDSITDGSGGYWNNTRWPNVFACRLVEKKRPVGVVNAGISGNRILTEQEDAFGINAIARMDRDVLSRPSVQTLFYLEGINDIHMPDLFHVPPRYATATEILGGYQQIVTRAHAKGIKVVGSTLLPFWGYNMGDPVDGWTQQKEDVREAVNLALRHGHFFDELIDFDKLMTDPDHQPPRLRPDWDCGDHLHPNSAGYTAMGDAAADLYLSPSFSPTLPTVATDESGSRVPLLQH